MARVTCRCGETLQVKSGDPDRLVCWKCGAKIRVHRSPSAPRASAAAAPDDGYVRFNCPCGRRLKVQAADRPDAGKCPDCGRVVPVPDAAWDSPESAGGAGDAGPFRTRPSQCPHRRHGRRGPGAPGAVGEPAPGRVQCRREFAGRCHHRLVSVACSQPWSRNLSGAPRLPRSRWRPVCGSAPAVASPFT